MSPKKLKINFHKKFKLSTTDEILHALKTPGKRTQINDKKFRFLLNFFGDIKKPTDDLDWLVRYNVKGQDCHNFYRDYSNILSKRNGIKKQIYYVKVGNFKNLQFDDLVEYSKLFFDENVVNSLPDEIIIKTIMNNNQVVMIKAFYKSFESSLNFRIQFEKIQIKTSSINKFLNKIKPRDACCLIGFTEYDLYSDESDLFVSGMCNGCFSTGVFSIMRYQPKMNFSEEKWFEYTPSKTFDKKIWLKRSIKLMVHETCHLLGFDHCKYKDCCMNGSGHLTEDFRQSMFLCPIDLKKLWLLFDFDIKQRYFKMNRFFEQKNCIEESKWLKKVLDEI